LGGLDLVVEEVAAFEVSHGVLQGCDNRAIFPMAMRSAMKNDHRHRNRKPAKKSPSNRKFNSKIAKSSLSMIGSRNIEQIPVSCSDKTSKFATSKRKKKEEKVD
jgi:hypothetical protein